MFVSVPSVPVVHLIGRSLRVPSRVPSDTDVVLIASNSKTRCRFLALLMLMAIYFTGVG